MIYDPHHVPYGSLNLHPEMWYEFQKNDHLIEIATSVKKVLDDGMEASVQSIVLDDLAFEATINTEIPTCLVRGYSKAHWAGVAICILAHCRMMHDLADYYMSNPSHTGVIRFMKTPYDNKPYLPENIVREVNKNGIKEKWVIKGSKPIIEATKEASIDQLNLF